MSLDKVTNSGGYLKGKFDKNLLGVLPLGRKARIWMRV
jgi:hypothetical protein